MNKIDQINDAIERATKRESKLTPFAMSVPMLGSLQIRHLLNNLGAISTHFLDIGSHRGGSYCSAVCNNPNLIVAASVDSWESDTIDGTRCEQEFRENVDLFRSISTLPVIYKTKCFEHPIGSENLFDFYSYDAGHSREEQKMALTFYKPILADEFIFVCDDWAFGEVKTGTMEGIEEGGYEILFMRELLNDTPGDGHLNEEWWRGYAVFLLKKKS